MKILIVEDEPLIAMMLVDMIETAGHEPVGEAASVADALALLDDPDLHNLPQAALVDLNLGGEPSYPVLARLRQLDIPFAIASGYGLPADSGFAQGDAAILPKPYSLPEVEAVLGQLQVAAGVIDTRSAA